VLQAPFRHLLSDWYDVQCCGAARVLTLFSGDVMSHMAFVYRDLGRHQDEFTMHEKVLQFRRKNTPPRHPDVGLAMHNFVPCLNSAGEHGKAFDLQCEAIRILAQSLPKNHPHLLSAQRQLADATDDLVGMYETSERHEEVPATVLKALEWLTTVPDCSEHNRNVGVLMCKLSGAYLSMGEYQNAAIWQEKGLQIHRRELTEEHATTCGAMGNLAFIYSRLSRHQDALSLREKVLHISRRVLPEDHVDIGTAVNNYARSLQDLHRHHEALPLLKQNLEFNKRVLPMNHPEIASSMNNLAITLEALHRNVEAVQLFEKALEFRRRVLPAHHPQIGQSMMNLCSALCRVGRFTEALAISGRAVTFFRQHMPPGHPALGGCVCSSGIVNAYCLLTPGRVESVSELTAVLTRHFFAGNALEAHAFVQLHCK
jgi:tetratricopeptide (TPR) repeat protein